MSGIWTVQDQEWWSKPENRFVYLFNQIFTSPKWQELFETRTPEIQKLREKELKKIFLESVSDMGATKEEAEQLDAFNPELLEQKISKLLQEEQPITESEAQDLAHLICELPEIKFLIIHS